MAKLIGALVVTVMLAVPYPAEAAWVLWQSRQTTGPGIEKETLDWSPLAGYEEAAQCRTALMERVKDGVEGLGRVPEAGKVYVIRGAEGPPEGYTSVNAKGMQTIWLRCLPDTVDPRGPKPK